MINQQLASGFPDGLPRLWVRESTYSTGEFTREFLLFTRFMDYVGRDVARQMMIFVNHLE